MQLIPLKTQRIVKGDDLVSALLDAKKSDPEVAVRAGDIVVISSKAVATAEGRIVDLKKMKVTQEAEKLAMQCGRSPAFCQAVLEETALRNGIVRGTCPGAMLTELRPWSKDPIGNWKLEIGNSQMGTIFAANAGLDESNIEKGYAVGWPENPPQSAGRLRRVLEEHMRQLLVSRFWLMVRKTFKSRLKTINSKLETDRPRVAVVLSDSCCLPRRRGVTAFALAVSGIDPVRNDVGINDLFGKPLRITSEAIADQLATAANMVMGNAAQSIPAVIVRDHGISLSDFEGWVPGIEPREDLFAELQG